MKWSQSMTEEEETAVKVLRTTDLIRLARPITGTSALTSKIHTPLSKPQSTGGKPVLSGNTYQSPNCRTLEPLSYPAVLVGTLTLPCFKSNDGNANFTFQCSCFQFNDGSATVCCDILGFRPELIGKSIRVCAWNFIPLKCTANFGGFLEIISWEFLHCISKLSAFPLSVHSSSECVASLKAKYSVLGVLESVSPLCVVACAESGGNSSGDTRNLCGFLSKVLVCECKLCMDEIPCKELCDLSSQNYKGHCFVKPLIVYFCGSASSWHPAIARLIQNVVSLSRLKKKLVNIGKKESQVMYLTSEKTSLQLPELEKNWNPNGKVVQLRGLGEVGSYAGTVTGIYMQGMVVELDQDLLLLLTDEHLLLPHSLRVGATVSVRNAHFVNLTFSWTKAVILGACFITTIHVQSFSALEVCCYVKSQRHYNLRKLIDTLTFCARLWVLLTITCLLEKFAGIFSEKEILGSKHSEGLAQKYITSSLTSSMYQLRRGVFMEYCNHALCECNDGEDYSHLKLAVPISFLVSYSETSWMKMLFDWTKNLNNMDSIIQSHSMSSCGRSYTKRIRRIIFSEDIGIKLLGNLKVSSSSGKLQLSDATGSIDVVVIDLPSIWDFKTIYEVEDFNVIMQGVPHEVYHLDLVTAESFTCRSIFSGAPSKSKTKLLLHLYYNFRDQQPRYDIYSLNTNGKGCPEPEFGRFHLLWLEHKYSLLKEFIGDDALPGRSSVFAEAIVLPWDLTFGKEDEITHLSSAPLNQPRNSIKYSGKDRLKHDITIKKCKSDETLNRTLGSGRSNAGNMINCLSETTSCSNSYTDEKFWDLSSRVPCLICSKNSKVPCQGFLHCRDRKAIKNPGCKPDGRKVFLEFGSESFYLYEGLRIGGYYIVQQNEKDLLCSINDGHKIAHRTFFITSMTCFWSLSFSSCEVVLNSESSIYDDELLPDVYQHQSSSQIFGEVNPEFCSDINLFIPVDIIGYLKVDLELSHNDRISPNASFQGKRDIHNGNKLLIIEPMLSSGTFHSGILLPEGDLISLHGTVLAVHEFNHGSFVAHPRNGSSPNILERRVSQVSGNICICVLMDHDMARIFGALGDYALPTGFGEGTYVSFHRVLVVGERNEYMLTPASFIVVNSVNDANFLSKEESCSAPASALTQSTATDITSPLALISEITKKVDLKPIQLRCRVVTLYILVLENTKEALNPRSRSSSPVIDIPLAGFILDDGSSSCCCWATHKRAATLLGIHLEACTITSRWPRLNVIDKTCGSTIGRLNKILRQHERVVVKNYGSMCDSLGLDLTFSVGSDEIFHRSDKDFLRRLIVNACSSTVWSIAGTPMDSNAVHRLQQQLTEMGMATVPVQQIWTNGVNHIDPLRESRERIQVLLNN